MKQRILIILVSESTFAELVNYHWALLTGKARYIMGSLVAGSMFDLAKEHSYSAVLSEWVQRVELREFSCISLLSLAPCPIY